MIPSNTLTKCFQDGFYKLCMKNMKTAETLDASLLIAKGLVAEYLSDGKVRPSTIITWYLFVFLIFTGLPYGLKKTPLPSFVAELLSGAQKRTLGTPVQKDRGKIRLGPFCWPCILIRCFPETAQQDRGPLIFVCRRAGGGGTPLAEFLTINSLDLCYSILLEG